MIDEARKAAEAAHERRRTALAQLSSVSSAENSISNRTLVSALVPSALSSSITTTQPDSVGVTELEVTMSDERNNISHIDMESENPVTSSPATLATAFAQGSPVGLSSITSESGNLETNDSAKTDLINQSDITLTVKEDSGVDADDEQFITLSPLQIIEAKQFEEVTPSPLQIRRSSSRASATAPHTTAAAQAAEEAHKERMRLSRERRQSLKL